MIVKSNLEDMIWQLLPNISNNIYAKVPQGLIVKYFPLPEMKTISKFCSISIGEHTFIFLEDSSVYPVAKSINSIDSDNVMDILECCSFDNLLVYCESMMMESTIAFTLNGNGTSLSGEAKVIEHMPCHQYIPYFKALGLPMLFPELLRFRRIVFPFKLYVNTHDRLFLHTRAQLQTGVFPVFNLKCLSLDPVLLDSKTMFHEYDISKMNMVTTHQIIVQDSVGAVLNSMINVSHNDQQVCFWRPPSQTTCIISSDIWVQPSVIDLPSPCNYNDFEVISDISNSDLYVHRDGFVSIILRYISLPTIEKANPDFIMELWNMLSTDDFVSDLLKQISLKKVYFNCDHEIEVVYHYLNVMSESSMLACKALAFFLHSSMKYSIRVNVKAQNRSVCICFR